MKRTLSLLVALALLLLVPVLPFRLLQLRWMGRIFHLFSVRTTLLRSTQRRLRLPLPFRKMPCMPQSWTRC